MQLVIRDGIVLSYYNDSDIVPIDSFTGASVVPFTGNLESLGRFGPDLPEGVLSDPRPYKAPATFDLVSYAATARFARETGGITVGGASVATDRESQSMIANAYAYLQASGAASVAYKSPNGFVTLSADQVKAIAVAIGAFVQACFATEADTISGIKSGKIRNKDQVDAAFNAISA